MGVSGQLATSGTGALVDTPDDLRELVDVLTAFAAGILFEVDRDARYLAVWTGDPALLARPADEIVGLTIADVLGPEGAPFHGMVHTVFDTGQPVTTEYTIDVQAGRRTFSARSSPTFFSMRHRLGSAVQATRRPRS